MHGLAMSVFGDGCRGEKVGEVEEAQTENTHLVGFGSGRQHTTQPLRV